MTNLEETKLKVKNLLLIPAGEQWIGHLQVAIQEIANGLIKELEYIERRVNDLDPRQDQ